MTDFNFSARVDAEDAFELWRLRVKEETGYKAANTASAVFVWLITTEEGRQTLEQINKEVESQ